MLGSRLIRSFYSKLKFIDENLFSFCLVQSRSLATTALAALPDFVVKASLYDVDWDVARLGELWLIETSKTLSFFSLLQTSPITMAARLTL